MKIGQFLKESVNNYSGKISSVVFSAGCNYRCPACHAKHILDGKSNIDEDEVFNYLESRKGWIEGVVLCGGEPTLQKGLPAFAWRIKSRGFDVKLDTNGSNPGMIENLLKEKIVDYVAMDVKAPKEIYPLAAGKNVEIGKLE